MFRLAIRAYSSASKPLVLSRVENNVSWIVFNRPEKKNAMNKSMYDSTAQLLKEAAADDSTTLTAITGSGDSFTSGNDFSVGVLTNESVDAVYNMLEQMIDHPKPIVALVNGMAAGIGVTMLGLFECVLASDKACEMLLFGKKFSAEKAAICGLVTEVFPHSDFEKQANEYLYDLTKYSKTTFLDGKALLRSKYNAEIRETHAREIIALKKSIASKEHEIRVNSLFKKR